MQTLEESHGRIQIALVHVKSQWAMALDTKHVSNSQVWVVKEGVVLQLLGL
jgi:hypothetical protein